MKPSTKVTLCFFFVIQAAFSPTLSAEVPVLLKLEANKQFYLPTEEIIIKAQIVGTYSQISGAFLLGNKLLIKPSANALEWKVKPIDLGIGTGTYAFTAVAKIDGQRIHSNRIQLLSRPDLTKLESIQISPSINSIVLYPENKYQLFIIGNFSDGSYYLNGNEVGTNYSIIDGESITISTNGIIKAVSQGTTNVLIENSGKQAKLTVYVEKAPLLFTIEDTTSIFGSILNANNEPISGVTITIDDKTVTTDSNGNYQISGLPLGTYTVTASKEGYSFSPTQVTLDATNTSPKIDLTGRLIGDLAQIAAGVHSCQDNSNQILLLDSSGQTVKTIDSSISGNGIDVTTTDWDLNKTIDFLVASELFKGNNAFVFNTNGEKIAALPVSTLNKGVKVVFGKFENGAVAIVINQAEDKKLYIYPNGKDFYSLDVLKNAADVNIVTADIDGDGIDEIIVLSAKQINGTNVLVLDSKGKSKASLLLTLDGTTATTKLPGLVGTAFVDQGKTILALGNAEGTSHQVALYSFEKDFKASFIKNFTPFSSNDASRRANNKITVCHNGKDLEVASSALPAHLGHGDTSGSCPTISPTPTDSTTTTTTTDNSSNTTGTTNDSSTTSNTCNIGGEGLLLSSNVQDNKPVLLVAQNGSSEIKTFDTNGSLLKILPLNASNQAITSIAGTNIDLTLPVLSTLPPIGVTLKDVSVIGTQEKPLVVEEREVSGRVHFENVVIGNITITINATITFGQNVRFKHKDFIPKGIVLSTILRQIKQPLKKVKKIPAAINLAQSIVINAPTILQQIQDQYPTLQQDQATGNLTLEQSTQRFSLKPIKVKQGDGTKEKGFSVKGTTILFVTQEDHEVELIPAMEETESLGTALEQEGIGNLEVTDAGQLSALLLANTSGGFYSGVPEMLSTPADDATPEGLQNIDAPNLTQGNQLLRALIFKDKQGKKRKQIIYPQFAEPTSIDGQLDLSGIAYFVVNGVIYRGRLDYGVIFGTNSSGSFNMQPKGDGNFIISYPSGKQQTFYPLK